MYGESLCISRKKFDWSKLMCVILSWFIYVCFNYTKKCEGFNLCNFSIQL